MVLVILYLREDTDYPRDRPAFAQKSKRTAQASRNRFTHFFPTSNADPDRVIHLASHGDMNFPLSVGISSTRS